MLRHALTVSLLIAATALLPACPADSIVGTWGYFDCDGSPLATVRFKADGTMSYEAAEGGGEGTWAETDGQVSFTATVMFNAEGTLIFMGTVIAPDRIEGNGTSDQAPGGPCVVLLR